MQNFTGKISVLIIFLITLPLGADTIVLKNGRKIEGQIVGQSLTSVLIRVGRKKKTYLKKKIRSIRYQKISPDKRKAEARRIKARRKRIREMRRKLDAQKRKAEREKVAGDKRKARAEILKLAEQIVALESQIQELRAMEERMRVSLEAAERIHGRKLVMHGLYSRGNFEAYTVRARGSVTQTQTLSAAVYGETFFETSDSPTDTGIQTLELGLRYERNKYFLGFAWEESRFQPGYTIVTLEQDPGVLSHLETGTASAQGGSETTQTLLAGKHLFQDQDFRVSALLAWRRSGYALEHDETRFNISSSGVPGLRLNVDRRDSYDTSGPGIGLWFSYRRRLPLLIYFRFQLMRESGTWKHGDLPLALTGALGTQMINFRSSLDLDSTSSMLGMTYPLGAGGWKVRLEFRSLKRDYKPAGLQYLGFKTDDTAADNLTSLLAVNALADSLIIPVATRSDTQQMFRIGLEREINLGSGL